MDTNEIIALVSRWLHVIPAILLTGGILFLRLALVPAANASEASDELREQIRRRWSKLVAISVLLLLVSGLYNAAMKAMGFHLSMEYNILLLVKIVLALAVFYLSAVLSGRSATAKRFRERETYWLNLLCILLIAIVMIAGYMKMSSVNFEKKEKRAKESARQVQSNNDPIGSTATEGEGILRSSTSTRNRNQSQHG